MHNILLQTALLPNQRNLRKNVLKTIKTQYADIAGNFVLNNRQKNMLVELNQLVHDLHFVETNKEMFSLPRAFNEAGEVLDHLFQKLLKRHGKSYLDDLLQKIQTKKEKNQDFTTQCNIIKATMINMHDFKEERLNKKVKRFKSAETIIGFLDILIPAGLILGVTHLASVTKTLLGSGRALTLFITVVTVIKVMLDRYIAIPVVEKWGRKLFENTTKAIKNELVDVVAAIFVLERGAQQEKQPRELIHQVSMRINALRNPQTVKK